MLYLLQNDPRVPAGIYGRYLQEKEIPHRTLHLYDGDPLPALTATSAVIVLGGYMGVHDEADYPFLVPLKRFLADAVEADIPLLGICLGGQLLADVLGGEVRSQHQGEKGLHAIHLSAAGQADPLFTGLPPTFTAFQWHNDSFGVPPGALHLAASTGCPGQVFRLHNAWGLQFHPEVDGDIVAAWSAKVDPEGKYAAGFAVGEAAPRAMAGRILENFLGFSQIAKE